MKKAAKLFAEFSALALLLSPLAVPTPAAAQGPHYTFFPSASTTDGRFLSLAGTPLKTLGGETIDLQVGAPAGASSFEIGIFDGDTGKDGVGIVNPGGGH